jgi:hypothetical protein
MSNTLIESRIVTKYVRSPASQVALCLTCDFNHGPQTSLLAATLIATETGKEEQMRSDNELQIGENLEELLIESLQYSPRVQFFEAPEI